MTKRTVTLPEAVSAINATILDAQAKGLVPAFSYGDDCLPDPKGVGLHCTYFPSYHLEFGSEFGSRVTLYFQAAFLRLDREAEFHVGTSGSLRSIEESQSLAGILAGVTNLAAVIREYLTGVNLVPTEEAVAYQAGVDAESDRRHQAAEEANKLREAEEKRVKALKTLATRRLNAAMTKVGFSQEQYKKAAMLRSQEKYQELIDFLAKQ